MSHETHNHASVRFRPVACAWILLMMSCASVSPRVSPVGGPAAGGPPAGGLPTFTVPAVSASVSEVKQAPALVSDDEVSKAQAALRDASAWGAEFYEPQMYAKAQAAFDAALASRDGDPARFRSLLAAATEAASSAKEAALPAYEADVKTRFETSRARLVEIGADRAFPDEFARLVSGIDAIADLFAAGSYWDARFKAYTTLKGMSDLYDTVRGLSDWLKDARTRVLSALDAAQAIDAQKWAPAEMKNAQEKYHDALTQMQAGDLKAAIDSMKAAGQIALRLPFLQDKTGAHVASLPPSGLPRAGMAPAGIPPAGMPALPEDDKEIPGPNSRLPPSAAGSLSGQRVRIAEMNMRSLGAPQRLYTTFSATVAGFDLVAAEGLRDAGVMEKVLSGMDDGWEAAVSRSGYFGFIYNDRIQMVKDLGSYRGKGEFLRTPYAAQFRLVGTRFAMNLVLCHIETNNDPKLRMAEMARLADVYHYYENLTGNRGITLLLAGGLGDVPEKASESLVPQGEMVSLHANLAAPEGSRDQGHRMFASVGLRPLIEESGFGASAPHAAYVVLKAGK